MNYLTPKYEIFDKRGVNLIEEWETPYGTIPAGSISNGASVPKGFRWFLHPHGVLIEAAIFHDHYYKHAIKTKEYADKSFKRIALDFGVSKFKSNIAYLAVKYFGKGNY